MEVKCFGTRGSLPVAGPDKIKYGGNTTCLQIKSNCLPEGEALIIDAGSGIIPFSQEVAGTIQELNILFTHWHYDHIQGFLLCPLTYDPKIRINLFGPVEHDVHPQKMLEDVMRVPYHPVNAEIVKAHIYYKKLEFPSGKILLFHPSGGSKLLQVHELERIEQKEPAQITFKNGRYNLSECLVIRMFRTNHPERTITYRFEERPTGRIAVILTDNENQDGIPQALQRHLNGVQLLLIDSQYDRKTYDNKTAGFGHGTPDYCIRLAHMVKAEAVGLLHHDILSSDDMIDEIVRSAQQYAEEAGYEVEIFGCRDYQTINV